MKTSARRIFLFAVLALAMVMPTFADTIFTNFGPGDTYNQTSGGTLTGSGFGGPNEVAVAFTPAVSEFLSTIELPVGAIVGNELDVSLDSSLLGAPDGLIESFHFSGGMGPFGSDVILAANSALHPLLSAGTQYWVVASVPSASGDFAAWNLNSIGGMTTAVQGSGSGLWAPLGFDTPTMRISGTEVPEPSSIGLLCSALVAGIALRKRLTSLTQRMILTGSTADRPPIVINRTSGIGLSLLTFNRMAAVRGIRGRRQGANTLIRARFAP